MTLSVKAHIITILSVMALSIMTSSIMTPSTMALGIISQSHNTSFSSELTNEPSKLESCITLHCRHMLMLRIAYAHNCNKTIRLTVVMLSIAAPLLYHDS